MSAFRFAGLAILAGALLSCPAAAEEPAKTE